MMQTDTPPRLRYRKCVVGGRAATISCLLLTIAGIGAPTGSWGQSTEPAQAGAQSTPPAAQSNAANPGDNHELSEIVVTAQKREQSINSVGMAITALTGDELKTRQINDVASLNQVDPSFAIAQGNWGGVVYQIRGIGYNDFSLAASPDVSVYSDEVPYAYPNMSKGATFDLERVEVLKGPQGTLYGQNATGGAVNYIAAKPTDTWQAGIEGTYARFNAVNFNGYVSGPLAETLQARLSFDVDEGGAWQKSYTRDAILGNQDTKKVRLLLDWRPMDRLELFININGWQDRSQTRAGQLQGLYLGHAQFAGDIPALISAPVAPQNAQAADWLAGTRPANDEGYYQGSVRAQYSVSDNVQLTYLGSYEHYRQNDLTEPDGANNQLSLLQGGTVSANSHEVRASGDLFGNTVNWLLGGEYARAITDESQFEDVFGTTSAFSLASLNQGVPFQSLYNDSTDNSVNKAVFANLEFHPTSQLGVHVGARYTKTDITHGGCSKDDGDGLFASSLTGYESRLLHGAGVITAVPGGCATLDTINPGNLYHPVYTSQTLDEHNVSWRAGIDWTPIEKTLLYASASKGYKAGSFPTLAAIFSSALLPVKQESLLAYEAGFKSRLLDNKVEIDGSVFYYDYANKQLEMRELEGVFGLLNTLVNIPKSQETGAELALKYRPLPQLVLTFRGTWLDSKVTSHYMGYNPFSTTPIDLKGEPFPNTPKWALGADAQYNWDINDHYSAYIGTDARYQTESQGEFGSYEAIAAGYTYTPSPLQPTTPPVQAGSIAMVNDAYGVIDLRAGIVSADDHWHYQVFANNVTNKYYWNQARLAGDAVVRFAGLPRTYGITVGYRY